MLLFDGGMGTYFAAKNRNIGSGCELSNLSQPELIRNIHREYLEAGSEAIKTNTFAANRITFQGDEELAERTIRAGWENAACAVKEYGEAYIFADIGPAAVSGGDSTDAAAGEYCWLADRFLELGAECFLFETNASFAGIGEAAAHIHEKAPEAFVLVSFAVGADGFSREGAFVQELIDQADACADIDAVGLNCICGARHMAELAAGIRKPAKPFSLMPNAGYPVVRNNRTYYDGDPDYFAAEAASLHCYGAGILGGCCGTTPVHIRKLKEQLDAEREKSQRTDLTEKNPQSQGAVSVEESVRTQKDTQNSPGMSAAISARSVDPASEKSSGEVTSSAFWDKLSRGEKVIAVELDPPADVSLDRFMKGAAQLKAAGTDIITIADCPIGRARMDSSLLACKVHRELQMEALPHMTCRDRNINATKALLLGLYAEGIRNVLLVTGDPVPTAERDEVKSVYQFNSRKLAAFASSLGDNLLPEPFHLFGALDVNARNFDIQLGLAAQKLDNGMIGFLTQPILTEQAFENLKKARKELPAMILGGIIPVVSQRNAIFMENEINGIRVDPKIIDLYADKTREEAEELAVRISAEIAVQIAPYVDGYYFMTPFGRTSLITRIIDQIR